MKKNEINIIEEFIQNKKIIYEEELKEYFFRLFPKKSEKYFNYYLMELYRNNILYKFDSNIWKSSKNKHKFEMNLFIDIDVRTQLEKICPAIIISFYNTSIFNNFTSLQLQHNVNIIEVYSYAKEMVFNVLLNNGKFVVFEEDYNIVNKYVNSADVYVIKTINEDSPIIRKRENSFKGTTWVTVPKIEKLLIDILVDDFYKNIMSSEITNIYYNILKYYQINQATLFRYAKKRYCYNKLLELLIYIGYDKESGEFI